MTDYILKNVYLHVYIVCVADMTHKRRAGVKQHGPSCQFKIGKLVFITSAAVLTHFSLIYNTYIRYESAVYLRCFVCSLS